MMVVMTIKYDDIDFHNVKIIDTNDVAMPLIFSFLFQIPPIFSVALLQIIT